MVVVIVMLIKKQKITRLKVGFQSRLELGRTLSSNALKVGFESYVTNFL